MKTNAPKIGTILVAIVIAVVGVIAELFAIPGLSGFAFWLVVLGFVVLAAGTLVKGL